jgi:hypothetical protein
MAMNASASELNQIQMAGTLAPVSQVSAASATAPVPRYRDFSVPQKLVNLRVTTSVQPQGQSAALVKTGGSLFASAANAAGVVAGSNVTFPIQFVNDTSDPDQAGGRTEVRDNLPSGMNFLACSAAVATSRRTESR